MLEQHPLNVLWFPPARRAQQHAHVQPAVHTHTHLRGSNIYKPPTPALALVRYPESQRSAESHRPSVKVAQNRGTSTRILTGILYDTRHRKHRKHNYFIGGFYIRVSYTIPGVFVEGYSLLQIRGVVEQRRVYTRRLRTFGAFVHHTCILTNRV